MNGDRKSHPRLLEYLPSIYQDEREGSVLPALLTKFEHVLFGAPDANRKKRGLRQSILHLPDKFDPFRAGKEFLPWLSQWVALSLRDDWSTEQQRDFIANAIPLYHCRGTKRNLEELLKLFYGETPEVLEPEPIILQVGRSTVGVDTQLDVERPHYFEVTIKYPHAVPDERKKAQLAETALHLIDMAKPAHTYYRLKLAFREE